MLKFLKLVQNELIKLMLKLSTWIIIGLLAIMCIGFSFLMNYADNGGMSGGGEIDYEENYLNDIEYYKKSKIENWQGLVEKSEFIIANKAYTGWRYGASEELFSGSILNSDDEDILKQAIVDDDWKLYCQFKMDQNDKIYTDEYENELYNWNYQYRLNNDIAPDEDYWKSNIIDSLASVNISIYNAENNTKDADPQELVTLKETAQIYEYRLENNISVNIDSLVNDTSLDIITTNSFNLWSLLAKGTNLISTIGIMVIVIAGGIVASEFSAGTIKFLLINPVKRWKILTAKYTTIVIVNVVLIILMYLIFTAMGIILSGGSELNGVYLYIEDSKVHEVAGFLYMAKIYALGIVNLLVMSTLAFTISSLIRSSALAIGVSMFAMLSGEMINLILLEVLKVDWGRYLIFANTDIVNISQGISMYEGHTLSFALGVIAVHMVVFLLTAWDGFVRREV